MPSNSNTGNNKQSGTQGSNQGSNRGFASMDPQKQREIAAEGGRAAHASGHAHEFTSKEAREAGRMRHKNDGNQQSGNRGNNAGSQNDSNHTRGQGNRR